MTPRTILAAAFAVLCLCPAHSADLASPSGTFNLREWKLQIPGPKEVKALTGYSSSYFHLNKEHEMCFVLDAAEKGTTPNTKYVRSELRHLPVWTVNETHSLSAEVKVVSHLVPDKVTVLQIHGITASGGDAPPLLRIAVNEGNLTAFVKKDNQGDATEKIPLKKSVGSSWFSVVIDVKAHHLKITVDNKLMADRNISWWKYPNYFKAGCYPQATQGNVEVMIKKLAAK